MIEVIFACVVFLCIIEYVVELLLGPISENNLNLKKPPSLTNIGANCYLNSALQGISSCDKFVKDINSQHNSMPNLEKLQLFNKLIMILNGCDENKMELSQNKIFKDWNKLGEQDSFELLSHVMTQVYNEIRDNDDKFKNNWETWLNLPLPMRLISKNRISCTCGNKLDTPLQSDLAFHVAIPSVLNSDLQTLINMFFEKELIEDYTCDSPDCDGKEAYRTAVLCRPIPRTICIHLQRSYWNGYKMIKKCGKIPFSETLIIKSEICCDRPSFQRQNEQLIDQDSVLHCNTYRLSAVIVHSGSAYGGHYICYKRVDNQWFLTDDWRIVQVDETDIFDCEAYILFYESDL